MLPQLPSMPSLASIRLTHPLTLFQCPNINGTRARVQSLEIQQSLFSDDSCHAMTFEDISDGQSPSTLPNAGERVLGVTFSSSDAVAVIDADDGALMIRSFANQPSPSTVVAGSLGSITITLPTKCHLFSYSIIGNDTVSPIVLYSARRIEDPHVPTRMDFPLQTAQPIPLVPLQLGERRVRPMGSRERRLLTFEVPEVFLNVESYTGAPERGCCVLCPILVHRSSGLLQL